MTTFYLGLYRFVTTLALVAFAFACVPLLTALMLPGLMLGGEPYRFEPMARRQPRRRARRAGR